MERWIRDSAADLALRRIGLGTALKEAHEGADGKFTKYYFLGSSNEVAKYGAYFSVPSGAVVRCLPGPPATCTIALLAAGEVASVTVRVRADAAGEVGNHAEVAVASDTNPANNASDVVVTVSPAPDDGTAGAGAGGDGNGGAGAADAGGVGAESGEGGTTDTGATNGGAADGGAGEGGDSDGRPITRDPTGCGCRMAGDVPRTDSRLGSLALASLIAACALRRRRKVLAAD